MRAAWPRAVRVWLAQVLGLPAPLRASHDRTWQWSHAREGAGSIERHADSHAERPPPSAAGPPQRASGRWRSDLAFACVCLLLLALTLWLALRFAPALGFYSPDNALKWLQVRSLRFEGGALRTSLHYAGRSFDPQLRAVPLGESFFTLRDGQIELVWPPWFALLSWPFEALLGARGLRVLPACGAVVAAACSALLAGRLIGRRARVPTLLLGLLASPLIVYGMLVWEHAITAALACAAVWLWLGELSVRAPRLRSWRSALAAAALALACAMRAELWVLCAALLFAAACSGREERHASLALGVWLAVSSVPFALWTFAHSAHALPANAVRNFSHASLEYLRKVGAGVIAIFGWGSADALAWLGVVSCAAWLVLAAVSGERRAWLGRARGTALTLYALIAALLVGRRMREATDTLHGLLESAPWLLLALGTVPRALLQEARVAERRLRALRLLARSLGAYVLFYLLSITLFSWAGPNGGREWGPRFILPLFPLAAPLCVLSFEARNGTSWRRAASYVCVGLALALQVQGLWLAQRAEREHDKLSRQLLAMPEGTLFVALDWWLPTALAVQFERRASFWLDDPAQWNEILARAACEDRAEVWLAGTQLPPPDVLRALTIPQLELEQHAQVELPPLKLRSLSARPRTPELCDWLR